MKKFIYLAIAVISFTSCGSPAHIEKSWRDPEVTIDMSKLNKVLVVALLKNEINRRATEDQLVTMLKGKGIASYNYLTKEIREDSENDIKQKLKEQGFDGAIIMRLADVNKDVRYVPGTNNNFPHYYGHFWPYYWNTRSNFYQPGYYESTKTFTVETNVYSLIRDKLVWSGLTSSVDPQNADKMMHGVAKEVYRKMKKEGFILND
ncbi:MAG TPA: hypothetical protein VGP43_05915 [Chitinophagaceae bacterium]|nr:hypothetical protein [Chitinophagaceae bacterium]